jgi:type 1 glutamine amidotransferase
LTDEWYNFQSNPRSNVHVVAALDEASYTGGDMGDHPIVWYHDYEGGRAWYTGLGHSEGLYVDPQFVDHLLGGIFWATGL